MALTLFSAADRFRSICYDRCILTGCLAKNLAGSIPAGSAVPRDVALSELAATFHEVLRDVDAQKLVSAVAELRPDQPVTEHLRIALLLCLQQPDLVASLETSELERRCADVAIQLSAASDQHAAVAGELDSLALTAPCEFTADHLWSLVRALKVQGRILNLYLGSVLCPSPSTLTQTE